MISMKDIAKEAGVSRATVSFVLNGKYGDNLKISEPVIRKVQMTAQRLGYIRNELVNSVVTGKSRVIALISDFSYYMMPASTSQTSNFVFVFIYSSNSKI